MIGNNVQIAVAVIAIHVPCGRDFREKWFVKLKIDATNPSGAIQHAVATDGNSAIGRRSIGANNNVAATNCTNAYPKRTFVHVVVGGRSVALS